MSQYARDLLAFHQIHPAIDSSQMDLTEFDLFTADDLDRLRDDAMAETERLGRPGRLYSAWTEALRRGLDEALPSMEAANGAMPKGIGQLAAQVELNKGAAARYPMASRMSNELAGITLDGQSLTDLPIEYSLSRLATMMVDAEPGPQRDLVSRLYSELEATPSTGFNNIEWDIPEERMTVEVNSSNGQSPDPYTAWRDGHGVGDGHGLESLAIKPSISNDPLLSGIVRMNPDGGGEYSAASDWALAAATSGGASDDD